MVIMLLFSQTSNQNQMNQFIGLEINQIFRYICPICNQVMKEPTQTLCGCRFCSICISTLLTNSVTLCPQCRAENIDSHNLMKDRAMEREINNLQVKCVNEGCTERFLWKQSSDHQQICEYRNEQCDKCREWYIHSSRELHFSEQCRKSMTKCDQCSMEMTREDLSGVHMDYIDNEKNICAQWMSKCPYKCENEELINVKIHLETCSNKPVKCPLQEIGCDATGSRDEIKIHTKEDTDRHQMLLFDMIQTLKLNNSELKQSYFEKEEALKVENEELRIVNSENEAKVRNLTIKVEKLNRDIEKLFSELSEYKSKLLINPMDVSSTDILHVDNSVTWTIRNIRSKIREASSGSVLSIISDKFYLSRPGYHMALKVYPDGDGRAKGTHLSAYFVIHRGEYDNELSWPFTRKVTLTLLSARLGQQDLHVHMKPDNNVACYGRPLSDANVGAGQPQLVPLADIVNNDHFIHSGALKLRINVES